MKELVSSLGITGSELTSLTRIMIGLAQTFLRARDDARRDQPACAARERPFIALDSHLRHGGRGARQQKALLAELAIGATRHAQAREPTPFEIRGAEVDASDHRGVAGRVVEFDGNLGCVIGAGGGSLTIFDALRKHGGRPANYCEIGGNPSVRKACESDEADPQQARRREDLRDHERRQQHARRHRGAGCHQGCRRVGLRPGGEDRRSSASPAPGRRGLQDPREVRRRLLRPHGADVGSRAACRREGAGPDVHPDRREHDVHHPGDHGARGREHGARVPRLRRRSSSAA